MVGHGLARAPVLEPYVGGDRLVFEVHRHHGVARLAPQCLADQPEWHGVVVVLKLYMGIAMDLDLEPGRQLGRHVWQGFEQTLFHIREALDGRFAGRAVDAVAGLTQHPFVQLPVGVG